MSAAAVSVLKVLAFELYLQDFSRQADQAGLGYVGWPVACGPIMRRPVARSAVIVGPNVFFR